MRKNNALRQMEFRNKLVLNQWLISLFGVDPLREHRVAEFFRAEAPDFSRGEEARNSFRID